MFDHQIVVLGSVPTSQLVFPAVVPKRHGEHSVVFAIHLV